MSFQEEKRESIKRYMLEKIRLDDIEFIAKTMENFSISVTTVKRYIKECLEKQIIVESKEKAVGYALKTNTYQFSYDMLEKLDEDEIYYEDVRGLLDDVSKEAKTIWAYCFTEMMNNAIEHSQGKKIQLVIRKDYLYTEISVVDDGIGIFKNLQQYIKDTLKEDVSYSGVLAELYKGKFTSKPENHSGEGIFFTSKVLNSFTIWSEDVAYFQGCMEKEKWINSHLLSYASKIQNIGTMVIMKLENQTTRSIKEVFDLYAPIEEGFIRTRIPVAQVCAYGEPIARSQARRILYRLDTFKKIEFDFTDVEFMGQGFADEIFRVFQNQYPDIELIPIHANETVLGMIKHVKR